MARFRIPPQHREQVKVVRRDAYTQSATAETTIAEDLTCMIQPVVSGFSQRDATELRRNVPIEQAERVVLLSKPNPDIAKGDILIRLESPETQDVTEYRIIDSMHIKGSPVHRLYLRQIGVL